MMEGLVMIIILAIFGIGLTIIALIENNSTNRKEQ